MNYASFKANAIYCWLSECPIIYSGSQIKSTVSFAAVKSFKFLFFNQPIKSHFISLQTSAKIVPTDFCSTTPLMANEMIS